MITFFIFPICIFLKMYTSRHFVIEYFPQIVLNVSFVLTINVWTSNKNILKQWFTYNCRIKGINNWMAISRKHLKYIIGCLNKIRYLFFFFVRTIICLINSITVWFLYECTEGFVKIRFNDYYTSNLCTCLLEGLHITVNDFNYCTVLWFWYVPMLTRVRFVGK